MSYTAKGDRVFDGAGLVAAECVGPAAEAMAEAIAMALNREEQTTAVLRSVEWGWIQGAEDGSYGLNRCPSCHGFEPGHESGCALEKAIGPAQKPPPGHAVQVVRGGRDVASVRISEIRNSVGRLVGLSPGVEVRVGSIALAPGDTFDATAPVVIVRHPGASEPFFSVSWSTTDLV